MTSDELADHVVAHLNSLENTLITFKAENPETIGESLKEKRNDYIVLVIPESESETPIDRGGTCGETRSVIVVINGPVKGGVNKKLAMRFCEQLRRSLCDTDFDGYSWQGNEVVSTLDFEALLNSNQYLSQFTATYYGIA